MIHVRDAVPDDRATLLDFVAALQDVERSMVDTRLPGQAMAEGHLTIVESQVARRQGRMLLAVDDGGRRVGFLACFVGSAEDYIVERFKRFGYVAELYVVDDARRRGVAGRLMTAAEDHFRGLGLNQTQIGVLAANEAAAQAYKRQGYRAYEVIYEKRLG